jgi:L-ascorbate metabolism protein UlaG (beta-lactamase superfamily)
LPQEPSIQIVFTPAQHFSGRGLRDGNQALWGGLSIVTPEGHLFFAGDTGYSAHFSEIRERLGAPRLALLPIGAYEPRAIMRAMHMNPEDAVQAHVDLAAERSLAIHYRTFQLTDEAMNQPLLDLATALTEQQLPADCFYTPIEGQMLVV